MKKFLLILFAVPALLALAAALWLLRVLSGLPDVSLLAHYRPAAASEVLDRNGAVLAQFSEGKFRIWIPVTNVPETAVQAVVTAEDDTFFDHKGVNYQAVWEALQHDVKKKRFARGGSTITQQMIKNVLLSREKTVKRKVREFVLARRAEEVLTKRQILEIYLNEVEWGDRIHGIEAASRFYFDKHAAELTIAESALLAGMLPNPRYYDPFRRPDKARQRQEQVLFNMFQAKLITEDEHRAALQEQLRLRDAASTRFVFPSAAAGERSCLQRVLEQVVIDVAGEEGLVRKGLRIRTTLDRSLQQSFAAALGNGAFSDGDGLLVLREGAEIRAISCSGTEESAKTLLLSLNTPSNSYEVFSLSRHGIAREQIIIDERK